MVAIEERRDLLLAYARRRLRDPSAAEDVVQETIMRVIEQSRKQSLERPLAYAYRVLDSVIYADARRRPWHMVPPEATEIVSDAPLADEQLEYRQRLAILSARLRRLPPMRRRVFTMRHIEGRSRAEISSALGISIEAVKKHLTRAVADMAQALSAHGITQHSDQKKGG